ncbi:hypothetical protein DFS33DRAFT_844411 [Desarmillaria ectypa]|nr:hypothetical protein DFS33DRAFT_844411 [Desarmillaria ectypa]
MDHYMCQNFLSLYLSALSLRAMATLISFGSLLRFLRYYRGDYYRTPIPRVSLTSEPRKSSGTRSSSTILTGCSRALARLGDLALVAS